MSDDLLPLPELPEIIRHRQHAGMNAQVLCYAESYARANMAPLQERVRELERQNEVFRQWNERDAAELSRLRAQEPVAWQWQHLIGNNTVTAPFWTEWELCTKAQYEWALANPDWQARELYTAPKREET